MTARIQPYSEPYLQVPVFPTLEALTNQPWAADTSACSPVSFLPKASPPGSPGVGAGHLCVPQAQHRARRQELQHSLTDQAGIAGPDGTQAAASCTRHGTLPRTQVDGAGRQHTGLFKSTVSWSPSGGERNALLFVACRHDLTKPRDGQTIKRN